MTADNVTDPKELARRAMVAAAHFAGASMEAYTETYPEQAALLAQSGGNFTVRVSDILSTQPRVALTIAVDGDKEIEIAHVLLKTPGALDAGVRHWLRLLHCCYR